MSEERTEKRYSCVLRTLSERTRWEDRQRIFYQMRTTGLPRKDKPFKGAADMYFPLIDSTIERMMPFYYNQVFQTERLAEFGAMGEALGDVGSECAEAFDWILKEETTFEDDIETVADRMMESGRGILKVVWNPQRAGLEITPITPLYMIVPRGAKDLESADWFVEIKHLSVGEYRRDARYRRRDEETINSLKGNPGEGRQNEYEEQKAWREGFTYSTDEDTIIVWEHWTKRSYGWDVATYSPAMPEVDLKAPFRCPYKWDNKPLLPYQSFPLEQRDRGWYAARGVAERLAPFQQAACKLWNDYLDWQTIMNRPYWMTDKEISNPGNFRANPGDILPPGVKPATMPNPPQTFGEQLNFTRVIAEQLINLPDFGRGQEDDAGKNKTATEMQIAASYAGQGIDLRGKRFRNALADFYRKAWAILVENNEGELTFYVEGKRKALGAQVRGQIFKIRPTGSSEQWDKQRELQKAVNTFQMFKGDPDIDQAELKKNVLRLLDGRWEQDLFIGQSGHLAVESEDEAFEIILMERGFPAAVRPDEDHAVRLQVLMQRAAQMDAMGAEPNPQFAQLLQQHIAAHTQYFQQVNPEGFRQFKMQLEAQRAAQQQQQQAAMAAQAQGVLARA